MGYLEKTIAAYDDSPEKYAAATGNMINVPEMEILFQNLPDRSHPILDVGCASGRDSQVFSDRGLDVLGIDMSVELLKQARQNHPNLKFEKMDIRKPELPDESFSGVWCNAVLLHLNDADLNHALQEIRRVLIKNGVLAVSFKVGEGEKTFVEAFSADLSRYYNFKTPETLDNLLTAAGFTVKESHTLNERQRFGSNKRDLNWAWSFATKS